MNIDLITVVPGLLEGPFSHSILKRAEEKGIATVRIHNLRDYATGKQKQVDDYAFGGGAGMVLMIEPIARCIEALQKERVYDEIIYMTPDGATFDQPMANALSQTKNLLILCGHYKGVDQRVGMPLSPRRSASEITSSRVESWPQRLSLMPSSVSSQEYSTTRLRP